MDLNKKDLELVLLILGLVRLDESAGDESAGYYLSEEQSQRVNDTIDKVTAMEYSEIEAELKDLFREILVGK